MDALGPPATADHYEEILALGGGEDPVARVDAAVASAAGGAPASFDPRQATRIAEALSSFEQVTALPDDPALLARLAVRKIRQRQEGYGLVLDVAGAVEDVEEVLALLDDPVALRAILLWETSAYSLAQQNGTQLRRLEAKRKSRRKRKGRALCQSELNRLPVGRHSDNRGHGLQLRVDDRGVRTWVQRLVNTWSDPLAIAAGEAPERPDFKLGDLDALSLEEARATAKRRHGRAKAGLHPQEDSEKQGPVFEELFEQVIHDGRTDPKKPWKIPRGKQVSDSEQKFRQLYRDRIAPTLGQRQVGTITAREVEKVVRKALDERQTIAAPVLTVFRRVFDLAVMRECRDSNPADAVARVLPNLSAPSTHHPSVPYGEAPAAFAKVQEFGRTSLSPSGLLRAQAMQVLILTGKRTEEVLGMRRGEIDLGSGRWTIPGERIKTGALHIEPLARQTLAILRQVAGFDDLAPDDLVFGRLRGEKRTSLVQHSLSELARTLKLSGTPHGFRSTLTTWLNEVKGVRLEVRRAQISHVVATGSDQPYDRSTFVAERAVLQQEYADFVTGHSKSSQGISEPTREPTS